MSFFFNLIILCNGYFVLWCAQNVWIIMDHKTIYIYFKYLNIYIHVYNKYVSILNNIYNYILLNSIIIIHLCVIKLYEYILNSIYNYVSKISIYNIF